MWKNAFKIENRERKMKKVRVGKCLLAKNCLIKQIVRFLSQSMIIGSKTSFFADRSISLNHADRRLLIFANWPYTCEEITKAFILHISEICSCVASFFNSFCTDEIDNPFLSVAMLSTFTVPSETNLVTPVFSYRFSPVNEVVLINTITVSSECWNGPVGAACLGVQFNFEKFLVCNISLQDVNVCWPWIMHIASVLWVFIAIWIIFIVT